VNRDTKVAAVNLDLQNIVKKFIGNVGGKENLDGLKNSIDKYLNLVKSETMGVRIPDIVVQNEGPFVTVNFQTDDGKRLETLGDMLEYMDGIDRERL